jgi:hypothetical protein
MVNVLVIVTIMKRVPYGTFVKDLVEVQDRHVSTGLARLKPTVQQMSTALFGLLVRHILAAGHAPKGL